MKRRNLTGIYIREKQPDGAFEPVCIEDCREETRKEWLESLDKEALIRTVERMSGIIRDLGDQYDLEESD